MSNELELVTSKQFDGHALDCYAEPEQEDKGNFWATREQIGTLLGYAEPSKAISNLHERNNERLDKFSTTLKLRKVEGSREVMREVIVYNFKGLLEICRYSQQPKANDIMDWLFDVADEIRRTGSYSLKNNVEELGIKKAEILQALIGMCPMTDATKTVFVHEAYKALTGNSLLSMLPESTEKWYTAGDIGEILGISANKVGRIANEYGLKAPEGESNEYGRWVFTKSRYSNHECSSFIYNAYALERLRHIVRQVS